VPSTKLSSGLLLFSALVVAACGLAYELVASALASYLLGDSVVQYSLIIGIYLFAMGVGAWVAQFVRGDLLIAFVRLELAVGVLGGASALGLFALFVWGHGFSFALYATVFWLGMLVGAEIPLLMRMLRDQFSLAELVSRVLAFDYLGALVAAVAFPLLLVPQFGLIRSAVIFGLINVAVAGVTLWVLRDAIKSYSLRIACVLLSLLLVGLFLQADSWSRRLESSLYGETVVRAINSPYQRIAITQHGAHTSLFLNGHLQFNSKDEYRYHEVLVHPVVAATTRLKEVLVLGGGDGLAVRELLRYPEIERIVLVDLDAAVTDLFSTEPRLRGLNDQALVDHRVQVINTDAWRWLESSKDQFDLIIADFPDPGNYAISRLFSTTFYRLLSHRLDDNGYVVVQATSPLFARKAFWCIERSLAEAGFKTTPLHVYVPSFGEWGFVIAGIEPWKQRRAITSNLRYLTDQSIPSLFQFAPDMSKVNVDANYLDRPVLVNYYHDAWRDTLL
jgi:spermidine synthase